jgi:hypothetical protein
MSLIDEIISYQSFRVHKKEQIARLSFLPSSGHRFLRDIRPLG